jgi:hypothetical protein
MSGDLPRNRDNINQPQPAPVRTTPNPIPPMRPFARATTGPPAQSSVSPDAPQTTAGNGARRPRKLPLGGAKSVAYDGPPITLTKFTKTGGPLTKQISLAADGTLLNDHSACSMARGKAERIEVDGVAALGALIEALTPSQALAFGELRADLPNEVRIVTEGALRNGAAKPGTVARTGEYLVYRGPAYTLLDFDTKGMPPAVKVELAQRGGFWPVLQSITPALAGAAHLTRSSTSAGLSRADTGAAIAGSDGVHVFIRIMDGADAERFLRALHARCWLAGFGWLIVSKSGSLLERSIVDRMVGGPEHLSFEGGPVLAPPLQQDKTLRRPVAFEGATLDSLAACPPLTIVEQAKFDELKGRGRARLAPEETKVRERFVSTEAEKLRERTGMPERAARAAVIRQCEGVLRPDIVLPFDDEALAGHTVGDVLADPERYAGATLADPLEGVEYGRCVAKVMRRSDGTPWIHSFAHGRSIYQLKHDARSIGEALKAVGKEDIAAKFATLAAGADLDAVEHDQLRDQVQTRAGVGRRAINSLLKAAKQQRASDDAKATRDFRAAHRQDPRLRAASPSPDAQWLPQIEILNEVLGVAAAPPIRDIDDDVMWIRKLAIPTTHAFANANPEDMEKTNDQAATAGAMGAVQDE